MYDVAIVGGGVVGCAIARELSRFHLNTVLLEKHAEVGFGTSKTNSGIIHAGQQTARNTLKGMLEVRGNAMFDTLQAELGFGFHRCGELVVASTPEQIPALEEMKRVGEEKGVPGLEMWGPERIRREEPNLSSHLVAALHAPSAGVINPYEFAFALIECAERNGVQLKVDCPVVAMTVQADHIVVKTPSEDVPARFVINAAGVYADQVAAMLGLHDFTIHPRKGEEYLLDKRVQGVVRRLVFPVPTKSSKGILIIPTFDGTIMVGPTALEHEDREDVATTYEGSDQVFGFVRRICPSIDERTTIAEFAGVRAVSNTGDFIIGPTSVKGFINVAGIQSPGLTASPAIAEHVVKILGKEGLSLVEKDDFNPHVEAPPRFAQQSNAKRKELLAKDRRFGKLVCRCELVTEAEVHLAIDHGARTVDGVKFRTRAGMGRCQGGFCTTRVMEILAERLGVPFDAVTKRGGSSWIVTPMDGQTTSDARAAEPVPAGEG
jgi:glycerol-3-phosphate dehydrogenase